MQTLLPQGQDDLVVNLNSPPDHKFQKSETEQFRSLCSFISNFNEWTPLCLFLCISLSSADFRVHSDSYCTPSCKSFSEQNVDRTTFKELKGAIYICLHYISVYIRAIGYIYTTPWIMIVSKSCIEILLYVPCLFCKWQSDPRPILAFLNAILCLHHKTAPDSYFWMKSFTISLL